MTDSADDKNNITTMKALVFHGPDKLAPEGRLGPNLRHDVILPCWQDHIMPAVQASANHVSLKNQMEATA